MQTVSNEWKAAHQELLVPESYVELVLTVSDPEAVAGAEAISNGEEHFSNASETIKEIEKEPQKFSTLEKNIWVLDGTCTVLPDTAPYGHNGYIGAALSNSQRYYDPYPTITISFDKTFTEPIPGITIFWGTAYNEWASEFSVTAYNNNTVVSQKVITNNHSMHSVVDMEITNYNKIKISIIKWCLPSRRARIEKIIVGVEKTFTKADLINYSHSMTVDPLSAVLPKAEIVFEISNVNGEYNPENPTGTERYLMERQMVTARYGYKINQDIEWIRGGVFFLSEWETPQNGITSTFTARDSLEYMSDSYTGPTTGSFMDIAVAALEQAGLPKLTNGENRWEIDESLNTISVPVDIDISQNSIMEVLQYIANAACCVFYQDREGILRIIPLPEGNTDYLIGRFISYENSEITLTKQLKAINVNNGQYILTLGKTGDTEQIDNPFISDDRAPIVANWAANYLSNRKELSGNFRADPRLDALDRITNSNQFADSIALITEITYTYNGAFRGSYTGKSGA